MPTTVSGSYPAVNSDSDATINGLTVGKGGGAVGTNTALGNNAFSATNTGTYQVALGFSAGQATTSGTQNTFLGAYNGIANTTGNYNTSSGAFTLLANTTGNNNTVFGWNALASNTTASNNTAVGYQAAYSNTTGTNFVAVGQQALYSNTTGNNNTAVGRQAIFSNTTGEELVGIGRSALYTNTTGSLNIAVGNNALVYNTTGSSNTAVGHAALQSNTTASNNTAVGYQAGYSGTTAYQNSIVGYQAGYNLTTGYNNSFIGYGSGYFVTTGTRNSVLGAYNGNQGGLDIRTASNYIVLSDGDGNPRFTVNNSGRAFIGCTSEPNASVNGFSADQAYTIICASGGTALYVNRNNSTGEIQQLRYNNGAVGNISTNGSNCTFNSTSDYRLKENIAPMTGALAKIQLLKPVTYTWKKDGQDGEGFIAHELQEVVPEAVTGTKDAVDEEGKPIYQAIDQSVLVATLTAAIQELKAEFDAYKAAHP